MTIEGVRNEARNYSYEPDNEPATCSTDRKPAPQQPPGGASSLCAWERMEASYSEGSDAVCSQPQTFGALGEADGGYTPGSDAVCGEPPAPGALGEAKGGYTQGSDAVCGEQPESTAGDAPAPAQPQRAMGTPAMDENCASDCPEPENPAPKTPPETYEQCVNRHAEDSSFTGRQLGFFAGAVGGMVAGARATGPFAPVGAIVGLIAGGVSGYYAGGDAGAAIGEADARVKCDQPNKPGSPSERALRESSYHAPIKG